MDVRALIGPAGSGKTYHCIAALRRQERSGRRGLMLVPEQFTYAADRLLLDDPDLPGARCVRVASFRRFAHLLCAPEGARPTVSPQGRQMLLRAVVHGTPVEELGPLAAVRGTAGFIVTLAGLLREIKGIAGRDAAARLERSGGGDEKTRACGRIIARYDEALDAAGLTDPEERLHEAAARLRDGAAHWDPQPVWIDGFASFTPEDKVLLEALAEAAPGITVTVCADPSEAQRLLSEADEAIERDLWPGIDTFLEAHRSRLARPVFLHTLRNLLWMRSAFRGGFTVSACARRPRFTRQPDLARLEEGLFRAGDLLAAQEGGIGPQALHPGADPATAAGGGPTAPTEPTVAVLPAGHPFQEVQAWARLIDGWARRETPPVRYRDIAVIVRDLDAYRPMVQEIFARYAIPCFIDERRDATAHPLVRLLMAALHLVARGWSRGAVIDLLRNPLLALDAEKVDRIEHLSIEYGVEYERWWETDWNVLDLPARERLEIERDDEGSDEHAAGDDEFDDDNPENERPPAACATPGAAAPGASGGGIDDPRRRRREQAAADARDAATRFFPTWRAFVETWRSGPVPFAIAAQAARRLLHRTLAQEETAADLTGAVSDRALSGWSPDESERIARLLDEMLTQGEALMAGVPVDGAQFARLLRDGLSRATMGQTPRSLDAVTIAEPRRARINECRRVVFGGLVPESFPRVNEQDALFSDEERRRLSEQGLPMAYTAAQQAEEDPYLFYVACTRATERLIFSYPALGPQEAEGEHSPFLAEAAHVMGGSLPTVATGARAAATDPLDACGHVSELSPALTRAMVQAAEDPAAVDALGRQARERLPELEEKVDLGVAHAQQLLRPMPERLEPDVVAACFPEHEMKASVSRLETFARCPFKFFARYLLRIEPPPEPQLTPRSTGQAAHDALEQIFSQGVPIDPHEAPGRVRRIFAALAEQEAYRVFQVDPPSAYLWDRTRRALEFFLRAELQRLRAAAFQPAAVELAFGETPAAESDPESARAALLRPGPLRLPSLPALEIELGEEDLAAAGLPPGRAWKVLLRGRIDRLDLRAVPGGGAEAVVVDYKPRARSGSVQEQMLQGLNFQVGLYMLAMQRLLGLRPIGGLYYAYSPKPHRSDRRIKPANPLGFEMRGVFLSDAHEQIDSDKAFLRPGRGAYPQAVSSRRLSDLLVGAERHLRQTTAEILGGWMRAHPASAGSRLPCEWCDYAQVCRFDIRRHPVRVPSIPEVDDA